MKNRVCLFLKNHPFSASAILGALISLATMLLFSTSLSPFYPAYSFNSVDIDSDFFLWCGKSILEGKKPYLDFFDHKGILVFYFNALGWAMGRRTGVFFLYLVWTFLAAFFSLIAAYELFLDPNDILLSSSLLLVLFSITEGGNQNGEIVLPFIALPLIFFFKALRENEKKNYRIGTFLCGIGAGIAFNVRPTDALIPFSLCIFYFITWIRHRKEYKAELAINILLALLGFAMPMGICILVAYKGGYLSEMFHDAFGLSVSYGSKHLTSYAVFSMVVVILYVLAALYESIHLYRKKEEGRELAILMMVVVLIPGIVNIVDAKYPQYWISAYPFLTALVVVQFHFFPLIHKKKAVPIANAVLSPLSILIGLGFLVSYYTNLIPTFSREKDEISKQEIAECIPNAFSPSTDEVYYIDCNTALILWSGKDSTCRYQTYQSWHAEFDPEVDKTVKDYLASKAPSYVVVGPVGDGVDKTGYKYMQFLMDNYVEVKPLRNDSPLITVYKKI
jgi:hypothetical protein